MYMCTLHVYSCTCMYMYIYKVGAVYILYMYNMQL